MADAPQEASGAVSIASVVSSRYLSAVTIAAGTTSIVLRSRGVPDHVTPYWGVGHPLYEAPFAGQTLTPKLMAASRNSRTP